jgi:phosphopantothenoylcysteine decarboxylase/phosphopantothenate--cysteine ligase
MTHLAGKTIVLGVSGSIAAYKALALLRQLTEAHAEVWPILTRSAMRFVAPLSFSVLSGHRAVTDLWSHAEAGVVGHVELASRADALVLAPASANILAKLAQGHADDPLTAVALATRAPLILAPAMEDHMWQHPRTQAHVKALLEQGATLAAPTVGALASGRQGVGRMAEPENIVDELTRCVTPHDLRSRRVLVTAGPTQEPFDPVRFLSNHSTGKMGYALARAAWERGAEVTLVSGPTALTPPYGVATRQVTTTVELKDACEELVDQADLVVMAAAPADFRPKNHSVHKIKKRPQGGSNRKTTTTRSAMTELVSNPDVLATLTERLRKSGRRDAVVVVGFAAESEELEKHASDKLARKDLDMIVANDITTANAGFGADTNAVTLLLKTGQKRPLPLAPKKEIAHAILDAALASKPSP